MGFIQQIIDFILGLLGMKKTEQGLPSGQSGAYTDAQRQQIRNNAVQGLEHVQGAENIHVFGTGEGSRIVRSEKGADLVEEDGEQQWVERIDTDIPRAQWVDEWGPLNTQAPTLLEEFVYHESTFDQTRSGDPLSAEQKLKGFGYHSVGHYYYVRNTILKHFGTPTGPNLCDSVFQSQEFSNAVMKAHARMRGDEQSAALSANPELLAPVEGVTLEIYANLCARMAQGMQQPELLSSLAQHGLDMGAWERANAVWTDRMSKDTSGTITTAYSNAFMSSGQGQYAGAAGAAAQTGWNGSAAGGPEPISFEKNAEIAGAMAAWSKQGKDVNALLHSTFGMTAMDLSQTSTWWMTQMMADLPKFDVYNKLTAQYEAQYMGQVVKNDQDIAF
jgi:hypothetical protein